MTKIIDWKSSLYNGLMVLTCRNQAVKLSNFCETTVTITYYDANGAQLNSYPYTITVF